MSAITREQFAQWARDPVTLAVLAELQRRRQSVLELLGAGTTVYPDSDQTQAQTAALVGQAQTFAEMAAFTFDDLFTSAEETHDENP